jgi:thiol:disulfide interchange protein
MKIFVRDCVLPFAIGAAIGFGILSFCGAGGPTQVLPTPQPAATLPEKSVLVDKQAKRLTVLFFTADWCVLCQEAKPRLKELPPNVEVKELDFDEHFDGLVLKYNIHRLPTFVVLDENGQEIERCFAITTLLSALKLLLAIVL